MAVVAVFAPVVLTVSVLSLVGGAAAGAATTTATKARSSSSEPVSAGLTPNVVTIGDSIMSGHGLSSESKAWPALLRYSGGTGTVTNLACSGAGFVQAGACGTDYDALVDRAVAADPTLVVIQSSDNDLGESAADIRQATEQTVEHIRTALPDAEIVGFSTLWDQPGAVPAEVSQSSDDLRSAVALVGGTFIDVGQPIAGTPGLLQSDNEHPTDAGQTVLALAFAADLHRAGIAF